MRAMGGSDHQCSAAHASLQVPYVTAPLYMMGVPSNEERGNRIPEREFVVFVFSTREV